MPEVSSYLANALGIEVSMGNPFSKMMVDPNTAKTLAPYAPLYAIAAGLAMRES
jgi:Tfp pilus assembly PilM family ATPase